MSGGAQRGEGRGLATDHGLPVVVFEDGLAHRHEHLPGPSASEQCNTGSDEVGCGGVDEGDAAVEVHGTAAHRQALGEADPGQRLVRFWDTGGGRGQQTGRVHRQRRVPVVGGLLQHAPRRIAEGVDRFAFGRAQVGRTKDGPEQDEAARRGGAVGDRGGGEHEVVGQHESEPRIPSRDLLPTAQPHQAPFPCGVRDRDRLAEVDPRPRSGDVPRGSRDHHKVQDMFTPRQGVDESDGSSRGLNHFGY